VTDKALLRAAVKAARASMPDADRNAARQAIRLAVLRRCRDLALPAGSRIAAYQPLRTEPGSVELLEELTAAGYQVIVPWTLPDRDLDWLPWPPGAPDRSAAGGPDAATPVRTRPAPPPAPVETPAGTLGPAAIATARLVLVPAFAVDLAGRRLGRGGGSYDRALARVPAGTVVAALLFGDELVERVPTDAWDQPVTAAVGPSGWLDLPADGWPAGR
jgi:5-formyltetrahydrofolate cyclo-ligase